MTEEQTDTTETPAAPEAAADAAPASPEQGFEPGGTSPADAAAAAGPQSLTERPEVLVAGAFAGGLLLALVLRGVGGGD